MDVPNGERHVLSWPCLACRNFHQRLVHFKWDRLLLNRTPSEYQPLALAGNRWRRLAPRKTAPPNTQQQQPPSGTMSNGARPLRHERGPGFLAGPLAGGGTWKIMGSPAACCFVFGGWPASETKPTHPTPRQKHIKKRFRRTGPKISIAGKFLIPIKYRNCIFYSVS